MSQGTRGTYEFPGLPIGPIESGTSILVAGPSLAGTRELALALLVTNQQQDEGMLCIDTERSGKELIEDFTAQGGTFDRSRMAAIECDGRVQTDDPNVKTIQRPSDLTGIGIEYTSLYERLHEEGVARVRTGVITISTLLMYTDRLEPVFRFLHTLTGRVRSADGLGVCVVDPTIIEERAFNSIMNNFDGKIDLRQTDHGREIRVDGLADQPDGWQRL